MTGLYPYKIGMQRGNISPFRPYGLPTDIKILPQYLKEKGYSTHLIGKIVLVTGGNHIMIMEVCGILDIVMRIIFQLQEDLIHSLVT